MSIDVTGPDGSVHSFPDGTDPAVIKSTLAKVYNTPAAAPAAPAAAPKANDELGFLTGGAHVFNRILGAGSQALQHLGVDPNVVHGIGKVLRDPLDVGNMALGNKPVLTPLPNDAQVAQTVAKGAAVGQRPGKLGVAAGQVAATIPAAVASAGLAPEALGLGALRTSAPLVAGGLDALAGKGLTGLALQGAEQGAETSDSNTAAGTATDALLGAGGNLAGHGLLKGVGAFVAPRFGGAMNRLIALGVNKFPLGALSGSKVVQGIEDASRSIPLGGDMIQNTQQWGMNDAQRAYLQRVADTAGFKSGGKPLTVGTGVGHEPYSTLSDAFDNQYKNVQGRVNLQPSAHLSASPAEVQNTILQSLGNAKGKSGAPLANNVEDLLAGNSNHLQPKLVNGQWQFPARGLSTYDPQISGEDYKQIQQSLAQDAGAVVDNKKPITAEDIRQENRLNAASKYLRDALHLQQPDVSQDLFNTDKAYAMYSRAKEAVTAPGAGVDPASFTGKALLNATNKAAGPNGRIHLGSKGAIPGQLDAEAMAKVFSPTVGDSGTAKRTLVGRIFSPETMRGAAGTGATALAASGHAPAIIPLAASLAAPGIPYAPGIRDVLSKTLVGNSKNATNKMLRAYMDRTIPNAVAHAAANPNNLRDQTGGQ